MMLSVNLFRSEGPLALFAHSTLSLLALPLFTVSLGLIGGPMKNLINGILLVFFSRGENKRQFYIHHLYKILFVRGKRAQRDTVCPYLCFMIVERLKGDWSIPRGRVYLI